MCCKCRILLHPPLAWFRCAMCDNSSCVDCSLLNWPFCIHRLVIEIPDEAEDGEDEEADGEVAEGDVVEAVELEDEEFESDLAEEAEHEDEELESEIAEEGTSSTASMDSVDLFLDWGPPDLYSNAGQLECMLLVFRLDAIHRLIILHFSGGPIPFCYH